MRPVLPSDPCFKARITHCFFLAKSCMKPWCVTVAVLGEFMFLREVLSTVHINVKPHPIVQVEVGGLSTLNL